VDKLKIAAELLAVATSVAALAGSDFTVSVDTDYHNPLAPSVSWLLESGDELSSENAVKINLGVFDRQAGKSLGEWSVTLDGGQKRARIFLFLTDGWTASPSLRLDIVSCSARESRVFSTGGGYIKDISLSSLRKQWVKDSVKALLLKISPEDSGAARSGPEYYSRRFVFERKTPPPSDPAGLFCDIFITPSIAGAPPARPPAEDAAETAPPAAAAPARSGGSEKSGIESLLPDLVSLSAGGWRSSGGRGGGAVSAGGTWRGGGSETAAQPGNTGVTRPPAVTHSETLSETGGVRLTEILPGKAR
jgi:hypothetical protein